MGSIIFKCFNCNKEVKKPKSMVIKNKRNFCSSECFRATGRKLVICSNCNIKFYKMQNQIKRSKSGNNFCSQSCAATYNNKHKTTGTRISKLEIYIQNKLIELYPNLEILYNKKEVIESELDIYIPSLKLAFELNGIFHYKPIFGIKKFNQIINNDKIKIEKCLNEQINLIIIDISSQIRFSEKTSYLFLKNITEIINIYSIN